MSSRALGPVSRPMPLTPMSPPDSPSPCAYKGKHTNRSWEILPPSVIRLIASYHLALHRADQVLPMVWRATPHPRGIFITLRDCPVMEILLYVCPSWSSALESHPFWAGAVAFMDPMKMLDQYQFIRNTSTLTTNNNNSTTNVNLTATPNATTDNAHTTNSSSNTPLPPPPLPIRISPCQHFLNMKATACYICRVTYPLHSFGISTAKRTALGFAVAPSSPSPSPSSSSASSTSGAGATSQIINVCRDHARTSSFCGICLRSSSSPPEYDLCIYENEDEDSWPGIDATCRACRQERLLTLASTSSPIPSEAALTLQALGGVHLAPEDWETRMTVDNFVDLAEGSAGDVINVALEKYWLRRYTKLESVLESAVAQARYANLSASVSAFPPGHAVTATAAAANAVFSPALVGHLHPNAVNPAQVGMEMEMEEEEEDTEAIYQEEERNGVRELVMADWARIRIMNGLWTSPADQWYADSHPPGQSSPNSMPDAFHPLPWLVQSSSNARVNPTNSIRSHHRGESYAVEDEQADIQVDAVEVERRPKKEHINEPLPPTYILAESLYMAYRRALRSILLNPFCNLVRKIVIECAEDGSDPAIRAARMGIEEVVDELRGVGVWYHGYDWISAREEMREKELEEEKEREREMEMEVMEQVKEAEGVEEDSACSSPTSDATSPVLSSTTLQTTPSPPPVHSSSSSSHEKGGAGVKRKLVLAIPVAPVERSPRLLSAIPYIPETIDELGVYALESIKNVWREACAPLYQCSCSICERAHAKARLMSTHTSQYDSTMTTTQNAATNTYVNANPNVYTNTISTAPAPTTVYNAQIQAPTVQQAQRLRPERTDYDRPRHRSASVEVEVGEGELEQDVSETELSSSLGEAEAEEGDLVEVEVEDDEEEEEEEEEEEQEGDDDETQTQGRRRTLNAPHTPPPQPPPSSFLNRPRKRSCDEEEDEDGALRFHPQYRHSNSNGTAAATSPSTERETRSGSPPKRPRIDKMDRGRERERTPSPSPTMRTPAAAIAARYPPPPQTPNKKRGSEEFEGPHEDDGREKRIRVRGQWAGSDTPEASAEGVESADPMLGVQGQTHSRVQILDGHGDKMFGAAVMLGPASGAGVKGAAAVANVDDAERDALWMGEQLYTID